MEDNIYDEQIDGVNPVSSRGEPKGPPQACLFVASLAAETTEDTLKECFNQFGTVLKIKLLKDRSSRPYAFVQYAELEDADTALAQTNGKTLDSRRLRVEKAKVNRTLFLAKISRQLTNVQLREIVEEFGPVESVTIIKNHQTNKSKGCGFVKFIYREDAMDAFVGLKNKQRKWVVEWATSSNDPDLLGVDKFNIFIGGLNPAQVTRENLEERFSTYGEIENITLVNRASGEAPLPEETLEGEGSPSTGRSAFAFVRFKEANSAANAIEGENGAEWLEKRIRVQYCESQEMKAKRRATKYLQGLNLQGYNSPFYIPTNARGMQVPPMMMMGGLPMYNMPMAPDMQNGQMYSTPFAQSYPIFTYNGAPWLYAPQQQQQPQPQSPPQQHIPPPQSSLPPAMNGHHHTLSNGNGPESIGAPAGSKGPASVPAGGVSSLKDSLSQMSLGPSVVPQAVSGRSRAVGGQW